MHTATLITLGKKVGPVLTKSVLHHNLTLGKLISFSAINSFVGVLVLFAIQVPLVEIGKLHYFSATLIAGAVGLLVKFILNGLLTYGKRK